MRRVCRFFSLLFLSFAAVLAASSADAAPHYVFAHYMVCLATYGETVAGYQREIQEAQAAGIDGFAMDVGAWSGPDTYYKQRVALLYQAAESLNTNFKLFFSIEISDTNDIVDILQTYTPRTNSFRYNGKAVVSTFGQNGADWKGVFGALKIKRITCFFVPFFWPNPVTELPKYNDAVGIMNTYSNLLDGLFMFGTAGLPAQLAACNSAYSSAVRPTGRIYMATCSPVYWGCKQLSIGRRYFEYQGGEGADLQWRAIIGCQPDWVEITTWNDFEESSYIAPINDAEADHYLGFLTTPHKNNHSGYWELYKRYISWFKSGVEPSINRDALFYFYRPHSKNAVASNTNDPPVTWLLGDVQDVIYTTLFMTKPAVLRVSSGGVVTTNSIAAGMTHLRVPFTPGPQNLTVRRDGKDIIAVDTPLIQTNIQVYNYCPISGYSYGISYGIAAPMDLHVRQ